MGGLIICKGPEEQVAYDAHHLVSRCKMDSECDLCVIPSGSSTHSYSDGTSEFASCFRSDGNFGLGPEDGNLRLPRGKKVVRPSVKSLLHCSVGDPESGTCFRDGGNFGLGPDDSKALRRHFGVMKDTASEFVSRIWEVGSSGEGSEFCIVHSGHSGCLNRNEEATKGIEVCSDHPLIPRSKKMGCVHSSSSEGHSGAELGTNGNSGSDPTCSSSLVKHYGDRNGSEGASKVLEQVWFTIYS